MTKRIVTRAEVLAYTKETFGVEKPADVTVILSPRLTSKIGDPRGNISSCGHEYYMQKLNRATHAGIRDPQKFQLRWRVTALEPRTRQVIEVKQVKTPVAKAKAPKVTKVTTKETAKVG
jgi:hypothetical protein